MCAMTSGVVRFQSGQSAHDQLGSAQICSIFCSKILLLFAVGTLIFCLTGVHGDADLQQNSEVSIRDTVVSVLHVQWQHY